MSIFYVISPIIGKNIFFLIFITAFFMIFIRQNHIVRHKNLPARDISIYPGEQEKTINTLSSKIVKRWQALNTYTDVSFYIDKTN